MPSSDIAICNLALGHLGNGTSIASLTEKSSEARACNTFYEQARDECLRDFPWPFTITMDTLAVVATSPTASEWAYSYQYPSGTSRLLRIPSGTRNDSITTRVPFRVNRDPATGLRIILTDQPSAMIEYAAHVIDPGQFDADFAEAVALLLAGYIAPRVTGGDQFKLGQRAFQMYQVRLAMARSNALNEESGDSPPDSEFISSRA